MPGVIAGSRPPARVSGSTALGGVLTCVVEPGYAATFQWLRDGVAIAGATNSTYTLVAGDLTHRFACRLSGITYDSAGVDVPAAPAPAIPVGSMFLDLAGTLMLGPDFIVFL